MAKFEGDPLDWSLKLGWGGFYFTMLYLGNGVR